MADPCGAKTRSGGKCKAPAMSNGRCRVHGGASTGPITPNTSVNALKHGIYTQHLTDEELGYYENTAQGNVEHELRLCRIRLRRTLAAEAKANGEAEIDEVIDRQGGGEFVPHHETKKSVRDYSTIIDRIMGRIESLEKTRAALMAAQGGEGDIADEMMKDDTTIAPDEPVPSHPIL